MEDPVDFCKYIADIEKDPKAMTPRLKVRQFIQLQEHVRNCDSCNVRVERLASDAPKEQFPERGRN